MAHTHTLHTSPSQAVSLINCVTPVSVVKRARSRGQRGGLCLMEGPSSTSGVRMTRQVQMLSVMNTLSQRTVCECVLAEHVCTCMYVCAGWVDVV